MGHSVGATEGERQRLWVTFDQAADLCPRARPNYPPEVYERLLKVDRVGAHLDHCVGMGQQVAVPVGVEGGFFFHRLRVVRSSRLPDWRIFETQWG
jgi:hypothetical protein